MQKWFFICFIALIYLPNEVCLGYNYARSNEDKIVQRFSDICILRLNDILNSNDLNLLASDAEMHIKTLTNTESEKIFNIKEDSLTYLLSINRLKFNNKSDFVSCGIVINNLNFDKILESLVNNIMHIPPKMEQGSIFSPYQYSWEISGSMKFMLSPSENFNTSSLHRQGLVEKK